MWGVLVLILLAAAVGGGLFALGWIPKLQQQAALENEASRIRTALPRVSVAHPRQSLAVRVLQLPGDVQALEETTVYARTNGYLKRWLVDIGDRVQGKQLLAEVETPEIDDELSQAVATLGQLKAKLLTAEANKTLAETTLRRYESLAATKAISKQELDQRRAAADTADSTVTAAKADVVGGEAAVATAHHSASLQIRLFAVHRHDHGPHDRGRAIGHLGQWSQPVPVSHCQDRSGPRVRQCAADVFRRSESRLAGQNRRP